MNTPLDAAPTPGLIRKSPLSMLAVAALLGNAVLFAFNAVPSAPDGHNIPHLILSLLVAGTVALRFRWTPVVGALASGAQIVEGAIFLGTIRAAVDNTAEFVCATLFFAFPLIALVACVIMLVQQGRAAQRRAFVDSPAAPRT